MPGAKLACLTLLAAGAVAVPAAATINGTPLGHTGAFGEPGCSTAGCHRAEPLGGTARARVDVGSYVPGATQEVRVIIESAFASRWGFQLAARRASNPSQSAGRFESLNQFTRVRCADASAPPCGANELEYASHTSATPTGRGGRFIFTVNWTPPAQDVGDVVFTAAALAADGDGGTNNDVTALASTTSLPAPSKPPMLNPGGVISAAAPGEVTTISPKSLISVFGLQFAPPDSAVNVTQADFDPRGLIPEELSRVSLEFFLPGDPVPRRARLIYVQGDQALAAAPHYQINAQAPDFPIPSGGQVMVQAVVNRGRGAAEVRSNMVQAPVARFSPALFTFSGTGQGEAAAVSDSGLLISSRNLGQPSRPAIPGEVILLFGTGFGETDMPLEPGELSAEANELRTPVEVTIGPMTLTPSEILYAGAAPGFAGLVQFNLRIPAGVPDGQHAVRIRSGSNTVTQPGVTIAVAR